MYNQSLRETYNRSMRTEEAPPPPLQIEATPFSPGFKLYNKWRIMRAPDILNKRKQISWKYIYAKIKQIYIMSINIVKLLIN